MNEKSSVSAPINRLSPSELTDKIAQANVFDLSALERNRMGRLSVSQFFVSLAVVGNAVFNVAGFFMLNYFIPVGFMSLRSNSFLKAAACFGVSIAVIAIFLWKGKKGASIGFDRYDIKDITQFPLKSLLIIDLLLWRVAEYRGSVSSDKATGIVRTKDYRDPDNLTRVNPFSEEQTVNYYSYKAGRDKFPVSFEAYKALQGKLQDCRLYYLPLSKIMINMEVLQL